MNRRTILLAAGATMLGGCAAQPLRPGPVGAAFAPDVDAAIASAMTPGMAPGLGVAIYTTDGVYARGFGVTDVKTGEAATADTAFYIASTTKAFTALAMNALHHRGEIDLDTTLAGYAPEAPFPRAVRPSEVTLKNLLTHTSGISNGPIGFRSAFTGEHSPELLWSLLGASQVNVVAPLGSFSYTNVGYNILTILTDRRIGVQWQDLLAREIFEPASMTRTTAYMSKAEREGWSLARPHATLKAAGAERLDIEKTDSMMQSAGGLVVSPKDALRWLELLANDGSIDGSQVLPGDVVRGARERLVKAGAARGNFTRENYGLGWYIGAYGEEILVHHGGGFAGFASYISYMPERRFGVAVFVNDSGAGAALPEAVSQYVYDRLLGREAGDSAARLAASQRLGLAAVMADQANRARRAWMLTQPRAAYAGAYYSALVGTLTISIDGDVLSARFGPLRSEIEPYTQTDTMRVAFGGSGSVIRFDVGRDGKVAAAMLDGVRLERQ